MTDMYDEPRKFDGKLKPYPHEEFGVEVRRTGHVVFLCFSVEESLPHPLLFAFREVVPKIPSRTYMRSSNVLGNVKSPMKRSVYYVKGYVYDSVVIGNILNFFGFVAFFILIELMFCRSVLLLINVLIYCRSSIVTAKKV
jgi:hypothetical protein